MTAINSRLPASGLTYSFKVTALVIIHTHTHTHTLVSDTKFILQRIFMRQRPTATHGPLCHRTVCLLQQMHCFINQEFYSL